MKRPKWLPQFTLGTASQAMAALIVLAIVAALKGSRHAVADAVRWLAHPVDTPRVVFVVLLALAIAAGVMLLAALWKRLFRSGVRETPRDRAEDFRSAWESLADHLRRWQLQSNISEQDANLQEQYRDLRRAVLEKYARVQDDFRRFLEENVAWDLRESLDIELVGADVVQEEIVGPFERLWKVDNLPSAMGIWVRPMTPPEFSAWIGRRNDALSAFVTWMRDR